MKLKLLPCLALLLAAALPVHAAPDINGKFSTGVANATTHKPQSKLWFHDGSWWAIAYDGSNQRIWRFDGATFTKLLDSDALVDSRSSARADVVWDGTFLYVLMWHPSLPRFAQYTYDDSSRTWARLPGFPIDLPISGTEEMVLDRDSTGRLWVSFELGNDVRAIWSTTPDHLSWNLTGTVLASGVDSDDITTTIAFDGKVGVFWSDQSSWRFGFRYHNDGDPPETWSALEVVDTGSAVDDHINAACDGTGQVYVATKDVYNHINIYRRSLGGSWTRIAGNVHNGAATRPIIMVDGDDSTLHVYYTDWENSPNAIYEVVAPLSTGTFGTPQAVLTPDGSSSLNNVTGTKQILGESGGRMVAASTSSSFYWGFTNTDVTRPDVDPLTPPDDTPGFPVDGAVQVIVEDTGMGVDPTSIDLRIDGAPVPFTLSGTAARYVVTWTPATPLQYGRIYEIRTSIQDRAVPPLSDTETYHFKTAMQPGPLTVQINFQPQSETPPSGWTPEWGQTYTLARGHGWNKKTVKGRSGGGANPDPRLDTWVDRNNSWGKATFDFDVADGLYEVTVVAGSSTNPGKHGVEVEGDVLLNGQLTDPGQYLTIADYPVVVQDGQLSLRMGGAGGSSTKTQICSFAFTYVGPPPPPPPSNETPPEAVAGLRITPAGSDLVLTWDPVTRDTTGASVQVSRYAVYRGSQADFQPDRASKLNRIALVSQTQYVDPGILATADDAFYYVTAELAGGAESPANSDLALRQRMALSVTPGTTRIAWIALPEVTPWTRASELVAALNGGSSGAVQSVARIDALTQQRESWSDTGSGWTGTDFLLQPGEAYEIAVTADLGWNLVGVQTTPPTYQFTFHTAVANQNWIALPVRNAYADARALAEAMNGGSGAGAITKVTRRNPASGAYESLVFYAGDWRGSNFPLQPGVGLAVFVSADVPAWTPSVP